MRSGGYVDDIIIAPNQIGNERAQIAVSISRGSGKLIFNHGWLPNYHPNKIAILVIWY